VRAHVGMRLIKNRSAVIGMTAIAVLMVFSLIGPLLAHHGPLESDFANGVSPNHMPVGPNSLFLLGADRLFRDVLARLAQGGRLSLAISFAATGIATCIGATAGILAGWHEGRRTRLPWPILIGALGATAALACGKPYFAATALVAGVVATTARRFDGPSMDVDGLLMRFVDLMLAFPFLLLVMAIGAALDRTSALTMLVTLGATCWLGIARVLRAKTLQVRSLDFVEASRALGQSTVKILTRHVLPNVAGTLIVSATVQVAQMIVADSVISYLGVGISPPTPTWGRMLYEGQDYYAAAPWLVAAPAAAILLAVYGFNMLGEGLRDALDPRAF
jgi:ABC-type dipeptide/oligopeptide/nickel transport system permease subunit